MTTEAMNERESEAKETNEITFKCRFCGRAKPLSEMRVLTRFSPPIVACQDCEKKMG
ncbi:MAG: hypothetical protein OEZ00_03700 [Dehalococcoidia bacterium]|nr:hypothetical protein [Dehalococcoidia bacterium]